MRASIRTGATALASGCKADFRPSTASLTLLLVPAGAYGWHSCTMLLKVSLFSMLLVKCLACSACRASPYNSSSSVELCSMHQQRYVSTETLWYAVLSCSMALHKAFQHHLVCNSHRWGHCAQRQREQGRQAAVGGGRHAEDTLHAGRGQRGRCHLSLPSASSFMQQKPLFRQHASPGSDSTCMDTHLHPTWSKPWFS